MNRITVIAGLMLSLAGADALAQTVYRCGPGGREYSLSPCPAGREVNVADPRSADQQREGQAAAARDAKLAKDLAAERREREAAARGQGPAAIKPAAPTASAAKGKADKKDEKKSKPKKSGRKKSPSTTDGDFRATSPKRP